MGDDADTGCIHRKALTSEEYCFFPQPVIEKRLGKTALKACVLGKVTHPFLDMPGGIPLSKLLVLKGIGVAFAV